MNRKAKFAYIFMLIGFFVFMVSFLFILNHFLNGDFTRSSHLILKDKNITFYINTKNPDSTLYLKLYCSFKNSIKDTTLNNNDDEEIGNSNLIQLKSFELLFSILLCSSEKVYHAIIILICLFGFIILIHGCINFYKYDISLLGIAPSSSNISNLSQKMKKPDSDLCCIKKGLVSSNLMSEHVCPFAYEELPSFVITNDKSKTVGSRLGSYRSSDSRGTPNSPFIYEKNIHNACNYLDINRGESKIKYVNFKFNNPYRSRGLSSGSSSKFLGCDEIFL